MPAFSDYLEKAIMDHVFGMKEFQQPEHLYLALFTSPTDDAEGGKEVAGSGYARQPIGFTAAQTLPGTLANSGAVQFPVATPDGWGQVTHFGIYDQAEGGNRLVHGPLSDAKSIGAGDRVEFAPGSLVVTLE